MRILALLAGLLLAVGAAQANTHTRGDDPQALVQSVAEQVLAELKKDKADLEAHPEHINDIVDRYIIPHVDFQRMARWVLGKYWRRATPEQRKRFVEEFKRLLVRTYATSLLEYTDQTLTFLPFRGDPARGDVTVRSQIDQPGGFPVPIDYKLHRSKDGRWLIYDIVIDGVSLVSNYRSSFAREIARKGIDGLIETLAEKNQSGGA